MSEMTSGLVERVAASLTPNQREALQPGTTADRRCLVKIGLVRWKQRPGNRFPSLMPTTLGYQVRSYLDTARAPRPAPPAKDTI